MPDIGTGKQIAAPVAGRQHAAAALHNLPHGLDVCGLAREGLGKDDDCVGAGDRGEFAERPLPALDVVAGAQQRLVGGARAVLS